MADPIEGRDQIAAMVSRCIDGDEEAWEQFVRRYTGLVRHCVVSRMVAGGLVPHRHDVSDIVQDIFLALAGDDRRRLRSLRDRGRPEGWLCIVSRNVTIDWLRRRHPEKPTATGDLPERPAPGADNQRKELDRAQLRQALAELFEELSPRDRVILRLAHDHGLKMREIAESIGAPVGTVTSAVTRAHAKLRQRLRERYNDDLPQ